jgi:hypothetical protein
LAVAKSYITEKEEQTLREWSVSPSTWDINKKNKLKDELRKSKSYRSKSAQEF